MCGVNETAWDINNTDLLCSELIYISIYIDIEVYPEVPEVKKKKKKETYLIFDLSLVVLWKQLGNW